MTDKVHVTSIASKPSQHWVLSNQLANTIRSLPLLILAPLVIQDLSVLNISNPFQFVIQSLPNNLQMFFFLLQYTRILTEKAYCSLFLWRRNHNMTFTAILLFLFFIFDRLYPFSWIPRNPSDTIYQWSLSQCPSVKFHN